MAIRKNRKLAFSTNQMIPGTQVKGAKGIGESQPPRNRTVPSAHMVMMATYSPSMKSRYGVEEYSTAKPATSSDSASGRSKGGRFVSAMAEMKKITNIGKSGSQYQPRIPSAVSCASTIFDRLREPAHMSTVTITKPSDTS